MHLASETQTSILEICRLEQDALDKRSAGERLGDLITTQAGRMWFITLHCIWFLVWITLNVGIFKRPRTFDPFPFSLLTMIVSLEAIFLSLFILMSQNRASRQADHRSHLDLQINLLSERENTVMLQMLQALCVDRNLAIAGDPEINLLTQKTDLKRVADELTKSLPNGEGTQTT